MLCHISTKIVGVFFSVTNFEGSTDSPPGGVHGWVTQKYSSPSGTISSVGSTVVEFDKMVFPVILAPSVHWIVFMTPGWHLGPSSCSNENSLYISTHNP